MVVSLCLRLAFAKRCYCLFLRSSCMYSQCVGKRDSGISDSLAALKRQFVKVCLCFVHIACRFERV